MDFSRLQENLRQLLLRRIHGGELSGLQLARQAGVRQPHISNFLNSKRGLSLRALDRVLDVQHLSVVDLLDEQEIKNRASLTPPSKDEFENIVVLDVCAAALQPRFTRDQVKDIFKFRKDFLARMRPGMEGDRSSWQRFIVMRVSAPEGMSMYPRLLPGAYILVDRHYNSLSTYHRSGRSMYAVAHNGRCYFRYAEQQRSYLVLQSENPAYPPIALPLQNKSPYACIVGRISSIYTET